MEFKLVLVPKLPDEVLLYPERPLEGLAFIEKAGACLRRNLDTETRMRHITLGTVARYEISVPQALAIESGWFTKKSMRYLPCENNVLKKYIFYGASMDNCRTRRACYPYYQNEITLYSYIDELAILNVWRNRGYPEEFTVNITTADIPLVPEADDVGEAKPGDLVLDDLLDDGEHTGTTDAGDPEQDLPTGSGSDTTGGAGDSGDESGGDAPSLEGATLLKPDYPKAYSTGPKVL